MKDEDALVICWSLNSGHASYTTDQKFGISKIDNKDIKLIKCDSIDICYIRWFM